MANEFIGLQMCPLGKIIDIEMQRAALFRPGTKKDKGLPGVALREHFFFHEVDRTPALTVCTPEACSSILVGDQHLL